MSLKAKLEAVVYAAEEPVTLAQLSALFALEAMDWKAARAAAPTEGSTEPDAAALLNAELPFEELEQPEAVQAVAGAEGAATTWNEAGSDAAGPEAEGEKLPPDEGETDAPVGGSEEASPADAEAEAKRQARQRDREVKTVLRQLMDELIASYANDDRGIEIREIAGGYRMATKPECHDAARQFVKSLKPAMRLSLPALETLAVIAYKQPVTAPEVNEIRGVDSSGVFGSLLSRKLIATAGRKQVIGRPILYKTTKEFLLRFGLKDVTELPSMEEFEKMAELEFEAEASESEEPKSEADYDDLPDTGAEDNAEVLQAEVQPEEAKNAEQVAQAEVRPGETPAAEPGHEAGMDKSAAEADAEHAGDAEPEENETVPHE